MKRVVLTLAALAAVAAGCSGEQDQALEECFTIADCPGDDICFLGSCVEPGYSIQSVHAELTPPANTPYLAQQTREPLNLRMGYQRLSLSSSVTLSGRVMQGGTSVTGTLVARAPGAIPGHRIVRQTSVASGGFSLEVTPDTYDLEFIPSFVDDALAPLPPLSFRNVELLSNQSADLPYPLDSELVTVHGRVLYSSSVSTAVEGAIVSATSDTPDGKVSSSIAVTDSSGGYTLVLPPGAEVLSVRIRPGDNPLVPETLAVVQRTSGDPMRLEDVVLGVSNPELRVGAEVVDENDQPVSGASILFEGIVGPLQGRFVATAVTTTSGLVASDSGGDVSLLPGNYRVTVVPLQTGDAPLSLSSTGLGTIDTNQSGRVLVVKPQVRVRGVVRDTRGNPVANARVAFALRELTLPLTAELGNEPPLAREYSVTTSSNGSYSLWVDRGEADDDAEYEVIVEPEQRSALPRHRELLRVGTGDLQHDIHLFPASFIYGQVRSPGGNRLAGVLLAFYSVELGSADAPLLVGVAQTSTDGEFVVPLPTPD